MRVNFKFLTLIIVMSISSIAFIACSNPPDELIMTAEAAVNSAAEAGADEFSPKLFHKAEALLQEAKMLNEKGDHDGAKKKAEYAIIRAEKAEKNANRLDAARQRDREGGDE